MLSITDALKLAKEIGFARIARYATFAAKLVVPFGIWYLIAQWIGKSIFVFSYAIPGVVGSVIEMSFFGSQIYFAGSYDYAIMKRIENAGQMFASPGERIAKQYEQECDKILVPYLYTVPLATGGLGPKFFPSTKAGRITSLLNAVVETYLSYSIITLLYDNRKFIREVFGNRMFGLYFITASQATIGWVTSYSVPTFAVMLIILLYAIHRDAHTLSELTEFPTRARILLYFVSLFSVNASLNLACCRLIDIPRAIKAHQYSLTYRPFVDPLTVHLIIQQAVRNVEGSTCNVTFYSYKQLTLERLEQIAVMVRSDRRIPRLLRFIASKHPGAQVLEMANRENPSLYLGTIDNRCLFVGLVMYWPDEKIRVGRFYFDNVYVRVEFHKIMQTERDRSRQLEEELPRSFKSLIESMEKR